MTALTTPQRRWMTGRPERRAPAGGPWPRGGGRAGGLAAVIAPWVAPLVAPLIVTWAALGAALPARAATPPLTPIVNTARATLQVGDANLAVQASHAFTTAGSTPSALRAQRLLAPGVAGAAPVAVAATACRGADGQFTPLAPPVVNGQALPVGAAAAALSTVAVHGGAPVWLTLTDFDQNRDPLVAETVLVTVSSAATGDHETLRLTETGPSTGVFAGYVQTTRAASAPGDCVLSVKTADTLRADYADALHGAADSSHAQVLVDPLNRVFDARTGALVNGAALTLINADTGQAAQVFDDDGVTPLASTVVSGQNAADAAGHPAAQEPGAFRFPLVAPGRYQLQITPPAGYRAPSAVADADLQTLPGAPWQLSAASRGEVFSVAPGALAVLDVPLDPRTGRLELTKSASMAQAAAGDFVSYSLNLRNTDAGPATGLQMQDTLPRGFRLKAGSVRLTVGNQTRPLAAAVDATGRQLTLALPDLAPGQGVQIQYVAEVTVAAPLGLAVNRAQSSGRGMSSNWAEASVNVADELMSTFGVLVGRVVDDCDRAQARGVGGVRVQMEDGRMNVSDATGRWHLENVKTGSHVVQLDPTSLPEGYAVEQCAANSRSVSAGTAQLVDLRPGALWQVDFVLRPPAGAPAGTGGRQATPPGGAVAGTPVGTSAGTVASGFDAAWLEQAQPANAIDFPAADFVPTTAAVGLAVRSVRGLKPVPKMNGFSVSSISADGEVTRPDGAVSVATWRGLPIHEGRNLISVEWQDAEGRVVQQQQREVYYSSIPAHAAVVAEKSRLVADGKQPIVVALRLTDVFDKPLRSGMRGSYQIDGHYTAAQRNRPEARDALADTPTGEALQYVLGDDGTALIELLPSTVSGPLTLKVPLVNGAQTEIKLWVEVAQREWMVVGLVEGTLAEDGLRRAIEPLANAPGIERIDNTGRVALYAVGTIDRDTLLTLAYDSAKERSAAARALAQALRSDEYYLVYADASNPTQAALSSSKLYVRVDRAQFSAWFGDFTTDLGGGALTGFNRSLTGLRAEYRGQPVQWTAYAARTGAGYARDDIALDGTSGAFRLRRADIVPGSDKLKLQRRSLSLSQEVVDERPLTRFVDYRIDYTTGDVWLAAPQTPVPGERLVLVAEYETGLHSQGHWVTGGRAAVQVPLAPGQPPAEVGFSAVRDTTAGTRGSLIGLDVKAALSPQTTLKAEWAASRREVAATVDSPAAALEGQAWQAEVSHQSDQLHLVGRLLKIDPEFGLGTLTASRSGTRGASVAAEYKVNDQLALTANAQTTRMQTLALAGGGATVTESSQVQAGAKGVAKFETADVAWNLGLTQANENTGQRSTLAAVGVELTGHGSPVTLRASTEQAVDGAQGLATAPERTLVGLDYRLTTALTMTAQKQWLQTPRAKAELEQIGVRFAPQGLGTWQASVGQGRAADGRNVPMLMLSADHRIALDDAWTLSGSYMHQYWSGVDSLLSAGNAPSALPAGALDNYEAITLGLQYARDDWAFNGAAQWRRGDTLDKDLYGLSVYRKLGDGIAASAGLSWERRTEPTQTERQTSLRLAWSRRASDSPWAYLHRLDWTRLQHDDGTTGLGTDANKLLSNLHLNRRWADDSQISLHHAIKWVNQATVSGEYEGLTQFAALEGRYSLTADLDLGGRVFAAYSQSVDLLSRGWGADVGVKLADAAWISLGYNWAGLRDGMFGEAAQTASGFYLRLRWHFDQKTLHLNPDVKLDEAPAR